MAESVRTLLQVAVSGGEIRVVDVPEPALRDGALLVRTSHSLISVGTESSALGSGGRQEALLLKAVRNPALVRKVIDRVSTHGVQATAELVRSRVSSEQALGYSCAGVVTEVAPDVSRFRPGDRVACCGAGYASHAAVNVVPQNLVARLAEGVSFEEGAFGTVGAIALQGVRRCAPGLGDRVAVVGLGLIGQLTAQLLRAAGAVVIGSDLRRDRVERAKSLGMQDGFAADERDLVAGVVERTDGAGADAVIVTAAGGDPGLLNRSFDACRKKGRVVLVGDVPIRVHRDKIYKKEIDFLISTSYGPGRYDPEYEEKGHDYPFAYVRWTEGRNLEEVVRLIGEGGMKVRPLVDAIEPIERAGEAYASLHSDRRPIGVLLDYHLPEVPAEFPVRSRSYHPVRRATTAATAPGVFRAGVIGYGSYFRGSLLPLLRAHRGFRLSAVCSRSGLTVRGAVEKDGFEGGTTDYRELLRDPDVDVIYVATRHDLHFPIAEAAVEAGKHVFVEKPMTLTSVEGRALVELVAEKETLLTVGFNRRFSPHARELKERLGSVAAPKTILYRVNAGPLPADHWLLDPKEGGGRLLGEGVHFFDFLAFLTGAEPVAVRASAPGGRSRDEATVTIAFSDGSVGTVLYSGSGSPSAGKERVEVFAGGEALILDDFRVLELHGARARRLKTGKVEKGQREQLENFYRALRGEEPLGVTARDGLRATWCAEAAIAGCAANRG
jgi:predicted dehydrogenase/threonine dehydrogenase-like Zn-dependent dehydrogenase